MAERPQRSPEEAGPVRSIVLLVDDTPDTLAMLTDALEQSGYTALIATGGAAALAICARVTPDIILMDAMMPGLDGFETCRRLKQTGAVAHVPVVFMTALSETAHIVKGFEAGGVDYVTKPIVLDELFARLRVHVSNARAAQSTRLALDTTGRYLLAVDRAGALLWASPQAGRLLAAGLAQPEGSVTLPPAVAADLAGAAAAGGTSQPVTIASMVAGAAPLVLTYLGPIGGDEFLFQLASRDERRDETLLRERYALTMREAEVLLWLARGKSNRDIAEILALSPRTVNKHLEGVFTKLGVENRASAAVMASRVLGGGAG